jgi:hypothetical protein
MLLQLLLPSNVDPKMNNVLVATILSALGNFNYMLSKIMTLPFSEVVTKVRQRIFNFQFSIFPGEG